MLKSLDRWLLLLLWKLWAYFIFISLNNSGTVFESVKRQTTSSTDNQFYSFNLHAPNYIIFCFNIHVHIPLIQFVRHIYFFSFYDLYISLLTILSLLFTTFHVSIQFFTFRILTLINLPRSIKILRKCISHFQHPPCFYLTITSLDIILSACFS